MCVALGGEEEKTYDPVGVVFFLSYCFSINMASLRDGVRT